MMANQPEHAGRSQSPLQVPPLKLVLPIALLLCALGLAGGVVRAGDNSFDWDQKFPYTVYVVHITETSTLDGPQERDAYILHGTPPNDEGILLTGDDNAGHFINKAETVSGPFSTPRQVCNAVKGTPAMRYSSHHVPQLGYFDCDELYCGEDCAEGSGLETWDGLSSYPKCTCICKLGYALRPRKGGLVCVPCDELCKEEENDEHMVEDRKNSRPNLCACECEVGYDKTYSSTCEQVECPDHATNIATLQKRSSPFLVVCPAARRLNIHCCCNEGYMRWGGTCQRPVDVPPDRVLWWSLTPENSTVSGVESVLRAKRYRQTTVTAATYKPGSLPKGAVVFWGVDGVIKNTGKPVHNDGAHVSIVVNRDKDHLEMASDEVRVFQAGSPPAGPGVPNLKNPTYYPHTVWLPPDGTRVKPQMGRLPKMPREHIIKLTASSTGGTKWNCHGFVKIALENFVAVPDPGAPLPSGVRTRTAKLTPLKDPLGIPFAVTLDGGAIYGRGQELDVFLPGGFVWLSGEFLVDVHDDGAVDIHVLHGQADYYATGATDSVPLSENEMLEIRQGLAAEPARFRARDLEAWWEADASFESGGLRFDPGVVLMAAAAAGILVATLLFFWLGARRGRLAPAGGLPLSARPGTRAQKPVQRPAASPGAAWGAVSVVQGQASPRRCDLDQPVLTIGRSASSDLIVRDGLISRRHAQIRRQHGGAILHDLQSTNGTFVNGVRVTGSRPLRRGDVIQMGHTELIYGARRAARERTTGVPIRAARVSLVLDLPVLTIGRGAACGLVLVDSMVSRQHAQVQRKGGAAVVYDLGSTNGTFVNGERIGSPRAILPGDVIRLGRTELVFGHESLRRRRAGGAGRLVVTQGTGSPSTLELSDKPEVRIGRSRSNDMVIDDDPHVSARHAQIRGTPQGHEIVDLGSSAGVWVNGQRVRRAGLKSQDRIRLGQTELVYSP